jgi:hypothetical protein
LNLYRRWTVEEMTIFGMYLREALMLIGAEIKKGVTLWY